MQKTNLTNFISKYHLGGLVESVVMTINDETITAAFMDGATTVVGNVSQKINLSDGTLPIYKTSGLLKLLSALDNDIKMVYNEEGNKITSVEFTDASKMAATYVLSDVSVIKAVPPLKNMPASIITIPLTKEFANAFKKASSALSDSDVFAIESKDGKSTKIIVNYSDLNTNRITLPVASEGSELGTVCFPAKVFSAILAANSELTGTLSVASKLAIVSYSTPEYTANYYLMKLTNVQ